MNKTLKLVAQAVLIIIALTVLTACSGKPGSSELETLVKPTLANSLWDVVSIHKVDGNVSAEGRALGINAYDVKYEYEVKFKKGLAEMRDEHKKVKAEGQKKVEEANTKVSRTSGLAKAWASIDALNATTLSVFEAKEIESKIDSLQKEYGDFKTGEIKKLTGTCSFMKTEKGWKL